MESSCRRTTDGLSIRPSSACKNACLSWWYDTEFDRFSLHYAISIEPIQSCQVEFARSLSARCYHAKCFAAICFWYHHTTVCYDPSPKSFRISLKKHETKPGNPLSGGFGGPPTAPPASVDALRMVCSKVSTPFFCTSRKEASVRTANR